MEQLLMEIFLMDYRNEHLQTDLGDTVGWVPAYHNKKEYHSKESQKKCLSFPVYVKVTFTYHSLLNVQLHYV